MAVEHNYDPSEEELKKMKAKEIQYLRNWVHSVDEKLGNHLTDAAKDFSSIRIDMSQIGSDVSWLKKFFWIVATASVGALITGLFNLVLK